jgi:2-polyprenyl-3-methyl-5-hydroxy-6-metoxy-1,4-benzoquinol methylase
MPLCPLWSSVFICGFWERRNTAPLVIDTAPCPLCRATNAAVMYDLRDETGPEAVPGVVVRCRDCGMWFKIVTAPGGLPTAYAGEHGSDPVAATYLDSNAAREVFRQALAAIPRAETPQRLLDVGAAQGTLLEEAARLGFIAEGVDHNPDNVRDARAKGLTMRLGEAEDLADEAAFDVVTMMDIIEHLADPARLLAMAHRALRPGGTLVVYTPNHRAAAVMLARLVRRLGLRYPVAEIFGRNHVCFFDSRSLWRLLERAGFTVVAHRFNPYDPARPGQAVSRVNLAAVTAAEWLGRPFGRVFRMLVYARKAH